MDTCWQFKEQSPLGFPAAHQLFKNTPASPVPFGERIIKGGGDYVLALKGNQGSLHQNVKTFLDDQETQDIDIHKETDGDHGRIEERLPWGEDQGIFFCVRQSVKAMQMSYGYSCLGIEPINTVLDLVRSSGVLTIGQKGANFHDGLF